MNIAMVKSYFAENADLIGWRGNDNEPTVKPWKPNFLTHEQWPPNYKAVYAWRLEQLAKLRSNPELLKSAKAYYATRRAEFIMHWMDTYDPRRKGSKWIPFVFFKRQAEFIQFLDECVRDGENGLTEKCRDMGATWECCAYAVSDWLFIDSDAIGFGSRKQELVDKIGDPSSLFEKMRLLVRRLPDVFKPVGLDERKHLTFMKMINPENGSVIAGEIGSAIGRGGRTRIYFKDEAQPLDAKILTPFGWQTMGEMHVGSLVIGPDGMTRQVTHINDAGIHPVYRISFSDGTSTECSHNHLWTVDRVLGSKKRVTLRTHEIANNFRYDAPNGQILYRYRAPVSSPITFVAQGTLPLDPYIAGVLIGDGSINTGCISFTSADIEIVRNVEQRLPIGCKVTSQGHSYGYRLVDTVNYTKQSRARQAVIKAGIYGKKAETKFIPDRYKFASIEQRIELLQGLMDTDGSASGGTITYHTCSKRLADDVRFLVQSLGGVASLNVKPDHRGYRDMYCLHIVLPSYIPYFKLSRKNNQVRAKNHYFGRTITSVELIGEKLVRCITVNAPDGLYLTDHCIVTHNSAHYEHPEQIQAALDDNTNVQIDISSVNGLGNVFHRRREAGIDWRPGATNLQPGYVRVFVFDYKDHPEKTAAWHAQRKAKAVREGLQHLFAQEVERNYSAAISNTIIPYEWIVAAVDAHLKIKWKDASGNIQVGIPDYLLSDNWTAGLDVADGGVDRNALTKRQGIIWRYAEEWGERDPGVTTRRTIVACRAHKRIKVQYDEIGVGSAVKSEYNRLLTDEKTIDPSIISLVGWNAGAAVVDPYFNIIPDDDQSALNKDFFHNFKAQAWWSLRTRFYKTFKNITEGVLYPIDDLISLDSTMPLLQQLMKEVAQPVKKDDTASLRMVVDKKPAGTKSPNLADAGVMMYFPVRDDYAPFVGSYGM